jgi:hypothetical protein
MGSTAEIKNAIKQRVNNSEKIDYSIWTIGITSEPEERKKYHSNPKYWVLWKADSESVAREVENYFLHVFPEQEFKRMKGGTGGDIDGRKSIYVYIF